MLEAPLLSVRVRPFTVAELFVIRYLSRLDADEQAQGRVLARIRFLRVTLGNSLGWRAANGLRHVEAALIFLHASQPARNSAEFRRKAAFVRSFLDEDPAGNHAAMLAAALECDARRSGFLVESPAVIAAAQ